MALSHELQSNTEQWQNEIRAVVTEASREQVWLEKINFNFSMLNNNSLKIEGTLSELEKTLNSLMNDESSLQELAKEFHAFKQALPLEIRSSYQFDPEQPETIRQLLHEVQSLLLSRLLK